MFRANRIYKINDPLKLKFYSFKNKNKWNKNNIKRLFDKNDKKNLTFIRSELRTNSCSSFKSLNSTNCLYAKKNQIRTIVRYNKFLQMIWGASLNEYSIIPSISSNDKRFIHWYKKRKKMKKKIWWKLITIELLRQIETVEDLNSSINIHDLRILYEFTESQWIYDDIVMA